MKRRSFLQFLCPAPVIANPQSVPKRLPPTPIVGTTRDCPGIPGIGDFVVPASFVIPPFPPDWAIDINGNVGIGTPPRHEPMLPFILQPVNFNFFRPFLANANPTEGRAHAGGKA